MSQGLPIAAGATHAKTQSNVLTSAAYEYQLLCRGDLGAVNALYNVCYPFRSFEEVDWLYKNNPFGEPRIWGAYTTDGRLAGIRPAIPWRFFGPGGVRSAYQLVDALVAPEHRGRGLFRRLMTTALAWAAEERMMLFSFPNENSLAAYRALGDLQACACCQSRVKVLDWPRFVRAKLSDAPPRLPIPSSPPVFTAVDGDVEIREIERFDEDFEDVHQALADRNIWFTMRQATFLNWRYRDVPARGYTMALVSRKHRTEGYVIVRMKEGIAYLVDAFLQPAAELLDTMPALLSRFAAYLGASAICFRASESNMFSRVLGRHGVLVKQRVQTVCVDSRTMNELVSPIGGPPFSNPHFVMGDSDVW